MRSLLCSAKQNYEKHLCVVGMKHRTQQWNTVWAAGASADHKTPAETVFAMPVLQSFCLPSNLNRSSFKVVEVLGIQTWNSKV